MHCVEKHGFNVPLSQETLPFFYFVGTNNLEQVRDRDIWRQVMNENGFSPPKDLLPNTSGEGCTTVRNWERYSNKI